MKAVSPVLPSSAACEVTYAKDQPEYVPLPTFGTQTFILSRWELTEEERQHIAAGGNLFICVMNFGKALQPILPIAADPDTTLKICLMAEAELLAGS